MSEPVDRKLVEVPVASFGYRHEAEFAAGFLRDAGVPYRLQIDDPALGVPVSTSATVWVLAVDEERARQALEMEGGEIRLAGEDEGGGAPAPDGLDEDRSIAHESRRRVGGSPDRTLSVRQRVVSLAGGGLILFLLNAGLGASLLVTTLVVGAGVALVAMATLGWAPVPLKRILAALAGEAP